MNFNERTQDVIEYKGQTKKYRPKMTTFAAFGPGFPSAFSLFNTSDSPSALGLQYELLQHEWLHYEKRPAPNQPTGELTHAISTSSMAIAARRCAHLRGSATGFLLLTQPNSQFTPMISKCCCDIIVQLAWVASPVVIAQSNARQWR
jgi:hypothetical protein